MKNLDNEPIPLMQCRICSGTIWKDGYWRQCPDCGALSTEFGGCYPSEFGPNKEFKDKIEKIKRQWYE
jgi:hypothetical protein